MLTILPHGDPACLRDWSGACDGDFLALCAMARRVDALFIVEETPSLVIAAVFDAAGERLSATGCGGGRREALAACLGEVAETLALLPCAGDVVTTAPRHAPPAGAAEGLAARLGTAEAVGWVRARRLPDAAPGLVPAPLALRGVPGGDGAAASIGCAAGPTSAAATRSAALELMEREALVAWRDGAPARALLSRAGGAPWLGRIEAAGEPPVVVAASAGGLGSGAGETEAEALGKALRELAAAEAGARFAAARYRPADGTAVRWPLTAPGDAALCAAAPLAEALLRRAAQGRAMWAVDLLRPDLGVAVVKVLAPRPDFGSFSRE